ncbi:OsmC family peroxiredoxin, partial [Enterococcus faecium]|uniref:OsmC family peroxiredoxin n=3 Tax=Bacteria TaxID=2 RepID=UPI003F42CC91
DGLGKDGKGHVSTQSGVLSDTQYGFNTRFEDGAGTNPEELIAAAHASCFTMALSFALAQAGHTQGTLETSARVTLDK